MSFDPEVRIRAAQLLPDAEAPGHRTAAPPGRARFADEALGRAVAAHIARLGDDRYAKRERATAYLDRVRRALDAALAVAARAQAAAQAGPR